MTLFQSKMNFLSANSRFVVQNDWTYLPRITRETCKCFGFCFWVLRYDWKQANNTPIHPENYQKSSVIKFKLGVKKSVFLQLFGQTICQNFLVYINVFQPTVVIDLKNKNIIKKPRFRANYNRENQVCNSNHYFKKLYFFLCHEKPICLVFLLWSLWACHINMYFLGAPILGFA